MPADRPLGSRYVDYLEQFVRLKGPGPARAAADAAGGGARSASGGGIGGGGSGGGGIRSGCALPPAAGWEAAPRRAVARYYPNRSWLPAGQWNWQQPQQPQQQQPSEETAAAFTAAFSPGQRRRAAATAATTSALHGAGARLLPPLPPPMTLLSSPPCGPSCSTSNRPNSAPLPPGGMLLFDGGGGSSWGAGATATSTAVATPRRAKHRPTTTPDLESGAAALSLLRHEPPGPTDPRGSWGSWPATLRALPLPLPAGGGFAVTHDPITRHRMSDASAPPSGPAPFLCAERAPSPCTTARPSEAQAREAYASALEDYYANKRRAAYGGAARRYGRPAAAADRAQQAQQTQAEQQLGMAASWSAAPLLPARARGQTGAARPASPVGSRWAGGTAGAAAAAGGDAAFGGELAWSCGRSSSSSAQ